MAKFNLHDFVMKTIHKMITSGMEAEYKVMQYALSYYDKGVVTDDDMVQISEWIVEQEAMREVGKESDIEESDPEETTQTETKQEEENISTEAPPSEKSEETITEEVMDQETE